MTSEPLETSIVDPEALLMITPWLTSTKDVRLREAAYRWAVENHSLVPSLRLEAFQSFSPSDITKEFQEFAGLVNAGAPDAKWKSHSSTTFKTLPDAKRLTSVQITHPSMLRIRLRTLTGPTATSEAFTLLLSMPEGQFTTAAVARDSLFGQRQIKRALDSLAQGNWAERWQLGREYRYRVTQQAIDAFGPSPFWVNWQERIQTFYVLIEASRIIDNEKPHVAAADISTLAQKYEAAFRNSLVSLPEWRHASTPDGLQRLRNWIEQSSRRLTDLH
jgi:hypothetical protein